MTLTQAALGPTTLMKNAALVLAGTAFIAIAAKISVPMFPVPMTLQTLAILIVGLTFGSRMGAITVLAYLAQGAAGLPVFTATTLPGLLAFAGPTAGFLIGFVGVAYLAGLVAERGVASVFGLSAAAMGLSAALYIPGLAWPMGVASAVGIDAGWAGLSADQVVSGFMMPFVLGDIVKSVIAALVVSGAWAAVNSRKA
jgi:biotin transport system substrate-specific component